MSASDKVIYAWSNQGGTPEDDCSSDDDRGPYDYLLNGEYITVFVGDKKLNA